MDGKSLNLTHELLQQLQQLVPQAFSEGKLDTVALKRLLGEDVFVQGERYGLNWAGKTEAYQVLQQQTTTTLRPEPEQSVDWDDAEHVLIEGENLEVLKLLQKSYFGQIKMIYIDPPYNTGSDSFIYPDKFSESKEEYLQRIGDKNDEGYMLREGAFRPNRKENGQYHSNWLNMMLPRLYLARNLLRDDGVIFVSIDDNEAANLKLLMDEVFGEKNCIAQLVWQKKTGAGAKSKGFIGLHEYILCYVKSITDDLDFSSPMSEKTKAMYSKKDNNFEKLGGYATWPLDTTSMDDRPNLRFPIFHEGHEIWPRKQWLWSKERVEKAQMDNRLVFNFKERTNSWSVRFKGYLFEDDGVEKKGKPTTVFIGPYTQEGTRDFQEYFERELFPFPKPVSLIKQLFSIRTETALLETIDKTEIVLDFFSGSGTTAQAVMELNEADGGNRRYICVQLPEKTEEQSEAAKAGYATIADITAARIKKVIEKIEAARAEKTDLLNENKSLPKLGFRKFTLAPSNFKLWRGDVIETEADLVRQMHLFTTPQRATATTSDMAWELLLKNGYGLSEPVTVLTLDDGLRVYHTADRHLALVLDGFSAAVQDAVLTLRPKQVLLLDSLFAGLSSGDAVKTNAQLTFEDQGIAFRTV